MKRYSRLLTVVLLSVTGLATANTVEWIDGIGQIPPFAWSVNPVSPSTADVVSFSGPLDGQYGNSCVAAAEFGGTPYLVIDAAGKTVELKFQGPPPGFCVLIYKPAVGLKGDFGPLAPGNWVFKCLHAKIPFQINFTVTGGGGNTIFVDKNAPVSFWVPDGSSWFRAYTNLQDGLLAAQPGDTVHVADGTYLPDVGSGVTPGDRTASFVMPGGVVVLCSFAGWNAPTPDTRDLEATPTILSGDLLENDVWGLLNTSENSYHVVSGVGAGSIDGAVITAGHADGFGNHGYGGGVLLVSGSLVVSRCKIQGNKADFGGGVACLEGIAPVFIHTEMTGNWATVLGGCLYNEDANLELTNCLITGNACGQADILGGDAIFNAMGSLDINSCTIADNRPGHGLAPNGRALVSFVWGPGFVDTISIKNCIIRNGGNEIWSNEPGIVTLYYNNIEGGTAGYGGSGNIDLDPAFKNPGLFGIEGQWFADHDGYTLGFGSPSIDAGNQAFLPLGLVTDLKGSPRVLGPQVDQGAYEAFGLVPAVVAVPNVVGQTLAAAHSILADSTLAVGVVQETHHATIPAGRVISQSPVAGASAEVGSSVDLTLSTGPAAGGSWVLLTTISINLTVPSNPPNFPISTSGPGGADVESNFAAEYKVEVAGVPAVGGTWTATPASGTIPVGESRIDFTVTSQNVFINTLSPGHQKIAEAKIFVRPL